MKKKLMLPLLLLSSCSLFKSEPHLSSKEYWLEAWQQACPTSEGKGQLFVGKRQYAFHYESVINRLENFWVIALSLPLRGEESLIVPFAPEQTLSGSLMDNMDELGRKNFSPKLMQVWKKNWLSLIQFLDQRKAWSQTKWQQKLCAAKECRGTDANVQWSMQENQIVLTTGKEDATSMRWEFKQTGEKVFFNQQIVTLRHQQTLQTISLHLYPTACGK